MSTQINTDYPVYKEPVTVQYQTYNAPLRTSMEPLPTYTAPLRTSMPTYTAPLRTSLEPTRILPSYGEIPAYYGPIGEDYGWKTIGMTAEIPPNFRGTIVPNTLGGIPILPTSTLPVTTTVPKTTVTVNPSPVELKQ